MPFIVHIVLRHCVSDRTPSRTRLWESPMGLLRLGSPEVVNDTSWRACPHRCPAVPHRS